MRSTRRTLLRASGACVSMLTVLVSADATAAQSLGGSQRSLDRQNRQANLHDFTYIGTSSQLRRFVDAGYLVRVSPSRDVELDNEVSFPYARPEVELFIRRLGAQYRRACGEKLVVTSLTRPRNYQDQLRNGSDRSVHPTGMAMDLRRSGVPASCRSWLESVLLDLEGANLLEATRENTPPHYHIALFPRPYASYVDDLTARAATSSQPSAAAGGTATTRLIQYRVRRGDSLWTIARRHGTTVDLLKSENGLRSSTIYAGQVIDVPVPG